MKKNILSLVAVGLVLSSFAGFAVQQPAEAQCNNNRNNSRNMRKAMRRMQQRQARYMNNNNNANFVNPYYTQAVNPYALNNGMYPVSNQFYGNQGFLGNGFNNGLGMNGYGFNNGIGNGLIGGGLGGVGRILGGLF